MNKEKRRVPKLRFPGFTEDWEQRKLGAMCSLFTDGDWIESKDQSNEGIRLIQTGNIGVGKFIDKPENKKWISHSTFDNLRCKELLDGDILISRLPHPAGRACIVSTNNEKWITAVDCTIVRLLDRYSNKFILQSLCTYNYFHLIDSFLAGGTRQRVSRSNLSDINIMSPEKIEQNKIGLFFECVDNLITLHQRKLEHLNLKKKALLQKLFPKNGARYPELRFPGFTDAWEQRKLGNLYKRVNERNDGTLGRDKWISVAKMYFQDPDKVQSNNLDTRTYVMKKGDIAFEGHPNNEFKFGRFVLNDIGTGIISELFPIYRPITEYDLDFWKYAIQLERVMAPIFAKSITSSGNSSNKLDHNHFLNQELLVPNIDEQKKIGTLLSILSKNITLHQRKLEHLQLQKKALLQQMFV